MDFIIQTVNGQCRLDLCQAMQNAIDFDNWRAQKSIDRVFYCSIEELDAELLTKLSKTSANYCPVGTLEFVFKYIDLVYGNNANRKIKPLNVPKELEQYALGEVFYDGQDALSDYLHTDNHKRLFMKSMDNFKDESNGFIEDITEVKEHTQLIEENELLTDEWRVFIHNSKAVDIKKYSGDPFIFPIVEEIKPIIDIATYNCGIKEGTVDVGMITWFDNGEEHRRMKVIECHDFFSCGLYGFSDYSILPIMLWRTWLKIQRLL